MNKLIHTSMESDFYFTLYISTGKESDALHNHNQLQNGRDFFICFVVRVIGNIQYILVVGAIMNELCA